MILDPAQRAVLAGLADVLIPAGEGMPSASAAGAGRRPQPGAASGGRPCQGQ
jgi:hypothetical protein